MKGITFISALNGVTAWYSKQSRGVSKRHMQRQRQRQRQRAKETATLALRSWVK